MKINKVSMAIIAATAVLAVSPAVMAQTTNPAAGGAAAAGRAGGRTNMLTVESLDKALALTDAQKPKVKSALEEYRKAAAEARQADQSERRTKMAAARTDLDKKMKEILTPEQYTKYEAMPGRGGRNRGGAGGGAGGGGQ